MEIIKLRTLFFVLTQAIHLNTDGQLTFPEPNGSQLETGKPMPDFKLDNVTHYKQKTATLSDFKGKWLFLDFWSSTCIPCIKNMPIVNEMQSKFKSKIQFILVGLNSETMTLGHGKNIRSLYEKLRTNMGLRLISAYDSTLFIRWGIWTVPTYVIIDPNGIVRSVSTGAELTEKNIRDILNGEVPAFRQRGTSTPIEYDISKFPGSDNDKLVFRSIMTRANGEEPKRPYLKEFVQWPTENRKSGFAFVMQPLYRLYQSAYFGTWNDRELITEMKYPKLILETRDSSLFEFNYKSLDYKGLYNFNLAVDSNRSKNIEYVKKIFQNELKNAFEFNASVERRVVPVWKLTARKGSSEKLKTKAQSVRNENRLIDINYVNISIPQLINYLWGYHQREFPILDDTGIQHNIDIVIDGSILDFGQLRNSLRKNGLELNMGEALMDVIVITDN